MKIFQVYNKEAEYEPFIDYLKGFAIIGIVWLHCMPLQDIMLAPLWCGMSVSLFLLIQVFHACRHGVFSVRFPNLKKLWLRIIMPMIMFTVVLGCFHYFFGIVHYAGGIRQTLMNGGFGPGCYYPWIYLQFAFILPIVGRLNKLIPRQLGGVIFVFSITIEIICANFEMPEYLWRILFFRYALLIWLGYDVIRHGIRLSSLQLILSLSSVCFILFAYYRDISISPILIHNGWLVEHWPAYFYPAYLLLWLLRSSYDHIPFMIKTLLCMIGKSSYEIFLCQMLFFALIKPTQIRVFDMELLNTLTFLSMAWSCSIGVGMIYKMIINFR